MGIVKTENSKEEVTDIDTSSTIKVSSGSECLEQMNFRCHIPTYKIGLENYMKHEKNAEGEEIISSGGELSIKREISDINHEIDLLKHDVSYEKVKSIKSEDYEIESYEEYVEHKDDKRFVLSNKLDFDHAQYDNEVDAMKHEQYVEEADIAIEENIEKHRVDKLYQGNYSIPAIGDVARLCESGTYIEQHQPPFPAHSDMNKSTSQTHIKVTHKGNVKYFKCLFCEYIAKKICKLKNHFTAKHSENAELYQCFNCKYETKVREYFLQHWRLQHNEAAWLKCYKCDYKTKYSSSLVQHHRSKHDDKVEIFHCEMCDFKTKIKSSLVQHHKLKHDSSVKILHCELCDYKTKLKQSFLQHYKSKHDAAKSFHCETCDFKTKCRRNLLRHLRSKHDDAAEIFHCEMCVFETKCKQTLLRHHRLKHDDAAEIFHCETCDFKTKFKQNLLRHHKSKHNDAAER